MTKITYENFRETECDFVKYISQKNNIFKIKQDKILSNYNQIILLLPER